MSNEYGKQVADLTEDAFNRFDAATLGKDEDGEPFRDVRMEARAALMIQAAQAVATLALATEVRAVGLLLAAASHPAAEASAELARDAFAAAVIMLGLVEAEPEPDADYKTARENLAALYADGADPADADVEL